MQKGKEEGVGRGRKEYRKEREKYRKGQLKLQAI